MLPNILVHAGYGGTVHRRENRYKTDQTLSCRQDRRGRSLLSGQRVVIRQRQRQGMTQMDVKREDTMKPSQRGTWIPAGIFIAALLTAALISCSSRAGLKASDIDSSQDSIVIGRFSIRLGSGCEDLVDIPRLELRRVAQRKSIPYDIPDLAITEKDQRIELPIVEKVAPGTYDIRVKVVEESWDPTWLDAGMLTLARFDVPRGFLVYFGTVEIDVDCNEFGKHGVARYVDHELRDEHEFELDLFSKEHPEVHKMYQNRVIQSVPEKPWKRS
jgi:hypothetical protein